MVINLFVPTTIKEKFIIKGDTSNILWRTISLKTINNNLILNDILEKNMKERIYEEQ